MTEMTAMRNKRVRIVEDEYHTAEELSEIFAASGAVVLGRVSNTDDALRLIRNETSIDGGVLDVNLQGEMVYPVAAALKERGVPFVFATGYDGSSIPAGFRDVAIDEPVRRISAGPAFGGCTAILSPGNGRRGLHPGAQVADAASFGSRSAPALRSA